MAEKVGLSHQRCMHREAVNPPLPSICLHLLFPAKQTTRFPVRVPDPQAMSLVDTVFTGVTARWKQLKHHFFKGLFVWSREQGLGSAQLRYRRCFKIDMSMIAVIPLWVNDLIHFNNKQLCSAFILIHLLIRTSKPTTHCREKKLLGKFRA